jgi:hypothetical protein
MTLYSANPDYYFRVDAHYGLRYMREDNQFRLAILAGRKAPIAASRLGYRRKGYARVGSDLPYVLLDTSHPYAGAAGFRLETGQTRGPFICLDNRNIK